MSLINAAPLAAVAMLMVACTPDRVSAPQSDRLSAAHTRVLRTSGTAQDPIAVTVDGPPSIPYSGPYTGTYTASISGGVAPHYVVWKIRYCQYVEAEGYIDCQITYGGLAEGWNLTTVDVTFQFTDVKVDILVELRESPDGYATGVGAIEVYGPSAYQLGMPESGGGSGFHCSGGGYLWDEWTRDASGNWVTTGRKYRRNSCDGSREYTP